MKVLEILVTAAVLIAYFWFNWSIFDRKDDE